MVWNFLRFAFFDLHIPDLDGFAIVYPKWTASHADDHDEHIASEFIVTAHAHHLPGFTGGAFFRVDNSRPADLKQRHLGSRVGNGCVECQARTGVMDFTLRALPGMRFLL